MTNIDTDSLSEAFADILPKSQHGKIPALVSEVVTQLDNPYLVYVVGSRIATEWRVFGSIEIGLDACGDGVEVSFGAPVGVEW